MTTTSANAAPTNQRNTLVAAAFMLGATLSFTSMAIAGRHVASELDTFELMLFRSIVGVIVVVSIAGWTGTLHQARPRDMRLHGLRNVAHFAGQNMWFYAVAVIPLAQVFALEFTTPLWVALFAPLVLGERWTRARVIAVVVGFTGILMVAQPGQLTASPGVAAAALASIAFAIMLMTTKLLSQRGHSITSILLWLTVMQTGLGLICAGWDGDIALPSAAGLPLVIVVALAGLFAHFCIANALARVPATVSTPMDFLRLPLIAVIGYLFYAETLTPVMMLGAALILIANIGNLRAQAKST